MESRFELQLLSAFVDEALDPPRQLEVQARVEQDAGLRAEVRGLRQLRAAICAHARRYVASEGLVARLRESIGFTADECSRCAGVDWRRWFEWRPMALSLGVAVSALFGLSLVILKPGHDESLMQAAVTSHLRATTGQRLVDVASADRHTVMPWLSTRLAFSASVPEPGAIDATLVGGRIDSLEGRSVAALVYRLRDHVVDVFIFPMADDDAPIATASLRGFNVSHWSRSGLRYCVVSDLPRRQLVALAQALEKVDDAR
jgi:anti-sigma factor RsiW